MKTLALLRHTKSSWDNSEIQDFDRPLSQRGIKAAPVMGEAINNLGLKPDIILCSTSKRTKQTLEFANIQLEGSKIIFDDEIYLASEDVLLSKIQSQSSHIETVLIIGHNPGLHNLAEVIIDPNRSELRNTLKDHFPTGTLVIITFKGTEWDEIKPRTGELKYYLTPRLLGA